MLPVICVIVTVTIAWISAAPTIQQDAVETPNGEAAVKTVGDDQETSEFFLHKLLYKLFCGKHFGHGFGGYGGYGGFGGYGGGYGYPGFGGFYGR